MKEYHETHLRRRASILQQRRQTRQTAHQNQRPNYRQRAQATVIQDCYQHHIDHLCTLAASPQNFTEGSGKQGKIIKLVAGPNGPTWTRSLANEFGRLFTGIGKTKPKADCIEGTYTIIFTTKDRIPKDRKITYANFICNIRPQKLETHRVCLTAGGNKLDYPGDPSSLAVSLLNVKIHINSTISRAKNNARYMCIDIKNLYLGTHMKYFQDMRTHKKFISQEVLDEYDIIFNDRDFTYVEIRRGMYGLK